MVINLQQTAIDPLAPDIPPQQNTQARLKQALGDTQGNILKSHGRDNSRHVFITFKVSTPAEVKAAREWLAKAAQYVTSALTQTTQSAARAELFRQRDPGAVTDAVTGAVTDEPFDATFEAQLLDASDTFYNLFLSAKGYAALGRAELMPDDPSFRDGAAARAPFLDDAPANSWQAEFQQDLHALVIIADDTESRLTTALEEVTAELEDVAAKIFVQDGQAMRLDDKGDQTKTGYVREHFGFADGVSQPLFYAADIAKAKKRDGGIDEYDPSAPLAQVLLKDPAGGDSGYGSYFVYRKLQQNVQGFRAGEKALALELTKRSDSEAKDPTPQNTALAGAYIVGRFKDGTPVVEQPEPGLRTQPNNFTYDHDVDGVRCPFQAHVRKSNPRGDKQRQFSVPLTEERGRRIVRRGISYGPVTLTPEPTDEVGLLFLCAQSSIIDQFEFIQKAWANFEFFLRPGTGIDPVIGQAPATPPSIAQQWPKEYGSHNELDFSSGAPQGTSPFFPLGPLGKWVTMRGGEYFFAPSISGIKAVAATS